MGRRSILGVITAALVVAVSTARGEETESTDRDPVYSGPQKGERLPPLKVSGVYDDRAGKEIDIVAAAGDKPIFLVFVHKLTRPSIGLARLLTDYCHQHHGETLATSVVWLDDDLSGSREYLLRARRSLDFQVPVGISVDGAEGPGSYGLNRKVTLTLIAGKENRVTANFALVQPSDRDAVAILTEVVELVDGKAPTEEELRRYGMQRRSQRAVDPRLRRLLRRLRPADVTPEQVEEIAAEVEKYVGEDPRKQADLGWLARRVSRSADAGSAATREQLKEWVERYGGMRSERGPSREEIDPRLGNLLRAVIQKTNTPEEVERAAEAVEKHVADKSDLQRQLGQVTTRVVQSDRFSDYGTAEARAYLKKWSRRYGPEARKRRF